MTQEEKTLLLQDLCARLPYSVEAQVSNIIEGESKPFVVSKELTFTDVKAFVDCNVVCDIKPYLRPISSMTEEEWKEFDWFVKQEPDEILRFKNTLKFYNKHYIDYVGLIPMGLAIEAPEGMYN